MFSTTQPSEDMRYFQVTNGKHRSRAPAGTKDNRKISSFQQYLLKEERLLSLKYPFLAKWLIKHKVLEKWRKLPDKYGKKRTLTPNGKKAPRREQVRRYKKISKEIYTNKTAESQLDDDITFDPSLVKKHYGNCQRRLANITWNLPVIVNNETCSSRMGILKTTQTSAKNSMKKPLCHVSFSEVETTKTHHVSNHQKMKDTAKDFCIISDETNVPKLLVEESTVESDIMPWNADSLSTDNAIFEYDTDSSDEKFCPLIYRKDPCVSGSSVDELNESKHVPVSDCKDTSKTGCAFYIGLSDDTVGGLVHITPEMSQSLLKSTVHESSRQPRNQKHSGLTEVSWMLDLANDSVKKSKTSLEIINREIEKGHDSTTQWKNEKLRNSSKLSLQIKHYSHRKSSEKRLSSGSMHREQEYPVSVTSNNYCLRSTTNRHDCIGKDSVVDKKSKSSLRQYSEPDKVVCKDEIHLLTRSKCVTLFKERARPNQPSDYNALIEFKSDTLNEFSWISHDAPLHASEKSDIDDGSNSSPAVLPNSSASVSVISKLFCSPSVEEQKENSPTGCLNQIMNAEHENKAFRNEQMRESNNSNDSTWKINNSSLGFTKVKHLPGFVGTSHDMPVTNNSGINVTGDFSLLNLFDEISPVEIDSKYQVFTRRMISSSDDKSDDILSGLLEEDELFA